MALYILTDINLLLMVEKGIRGGICHPIYRYVKANNKYMQNYDKKKDLPNLKYWNVNDMYGCAMLQTLPIKDFIWV